MRIHLKSNVHELDEDLNETFIDEEVGCDQRYLIETEYYMIKDNTPRLNQT